MIMENMRKKVEWLEKNDNDKLIDLWDDYLEEILMDWSVFSNGNFNPDHKYYAFNEDISAYISFDTMADYECYVKEKDNFVMFLKKEGYIL